MPFEKRSDLPRTGPSAGRAAGSRKAPRPAGRTHRRPEGRLR
jgi:hypothetical protein